MELLDNILTEAIVQRLGWMLVHFIWQAAAVALVLAILLKMLRKSSANLRYIVACLALVMVVIFPVITMSLIPVDEPTAESTVALAHKPVAVIPAPVEIEPSISTKAPASMEMPEIEAELSTESIAAAPAVPLKQRITEVLEPNLPYLVMAWLAGVIVLSVWYLGAWTQLQKLRRKMVRPVDESLRGKLKELSALLGVNKAVELVESALVKSPAVVGWLKPVILLPASILTGFSADQIEAILAHELAHIKRCDYLVNMLQTGVEILGFYHPAVWWISRKIRAERENCCDDIAVKISGDRMGYARTLAMFDDIRAGQPELAVAAGGGSLFQRICRLMQKDSTTVKADWKPSFIAILLIIALLIPTVYALTVRYEEKPSSTMNSPNKMTAVLPNGDTVKLLGVCRVPEKGGHENWFKPDGTVYENKQFKNLKNSVQNHKDKRWYCFAYSIPDTNKSNEMRSHGIKNNFGNASGAVISNEDKLFQSKEVEHDFFMLDNDQETAEFEFGSPGGPWHTLLKVKENQNPYTFGEFVASIIPAKIENGKYVVRIWEKWPWMFDQNYFRRYVIKLKDQPELINIDKYESEVTEHPEESYKVDHLYVLDADMQGRIEYIAAQYCTKQIATFKNISLDKGRKTDFEVDVRQVPEPDFIYMDMSRPPTAVLGHLASGIVKGTQVINFHSTHQQTLWQLQSGDRKHKPQWYFRINGKDYPSIPGQFALSRYELTEVFCFPWDLKEDNRQWPAGDYRLTVVVKDTVWCDPSGKRHFNKELESLPIEFKILNDGRFTYSNGQTLPTEMELKALQKEKEVTELAEDIFAALRKRDHNQLSKLLEDYGFAGSLLDDIKKFDFSDDYAQALYVGKDTAHLLANLKPKQSEFDSRDLRIGLKYKNGKWIGSFSEIRTAGERAREEQFLSQNPGAKEIILTPGNKIEKPKPSDTLNSRPGKEVGLPVDLDNHTAASEVLKGLKVTLGGSKLLGIYYCPNNLYFKLENNAAGIIQVGKEKSSTNGRAKLGYLEFLGKDGKPAGDKLDLDVTDFYGRSVEYIPSKMTLAPGKNYRRAIMPEEPGRPFKKLGPGNFKARVTLYVDKPGSDKKYEVKSNWYQFDVTTMGQPTNFVPVTGYDYLMQARMKWFLREHYKLDKKGVIEEFKKVISKFPDTRWELQSHFRIAMISSEVEYFGDITDEDRALSRKHYQEIIRKWPNVVTASTIHARSQAYFMAPGFKQSRIELYRWLTGLTKEQKINSILNYGYRKDKPSEKDLPDILPGYDRMIAGHVNRLKNYELSKEDLEIEKRKPKPSDTLNSRSEEKGVGAGVNIFMLEGVNIDLSAAHKKPLSELVLEKKPWISSEDILRYDVSSHCIHLKQKMKSSLESVTLAENAYVVTADGERCYLGQSRSPVSSSMSEPGLPLIHMLSDDMISIGHPKINHDKGNGQPKDVREDPRIIKALRKNGQYHAGLNLHLNNVEVLRNDNEFSVSYTYTLTNKDKDNLYVFDPDKMGSGLFHYFTNGLGLYSPDRKTRLNADIDKVVKRPDPWDKIDMEWFSLLKSGESMTRNVLLGGYPEILPDTYDCSFLFHSPYPGKLSKEQLQRTGGRIWIGQIGAGLKIDLEAVGKYLKSSKPSETSNSPSVWNELILPDIDGSDAPAILSLKTHRLISLSENVYFHYESEKWAKDMSPPMEDSYLLYEFAQGKVVFVIVRGYELFENRSDMEAVIHQIDKSLPNTFTMNAPDGNAYEFTILKTDAAGCNLRYRIQNPAKPDWKIEPSTELIEVESPDGKKVLMPGNMVWTGIPSGWGQEKFYYKLYEYIRQNASKELPGCSTEMSKENIKITYEPHVYSFKMPYLKRIRDTLEVEMRGRYIVGPQSDGLIMKIWLDDQASHLSRPLTINRTRWKMDLTQVYLPELKLFLYADIQYGEQTDKNFLNKYRNLKVMLENLVAENATKKTAVPVEKAAVKYGGGSGTKDDPYQIWTPDQMNRIGLHEEDWDKHFALMADIDLGKYKGEEFNIIGYHYGDKKSKAFTGVFDGKGHNISNFSYKGKSRAPLLGLASHTGIFGIVGSSSSRKTVKIRDLVLVNPHVDTSQNDSATGSLAGTLFNGNIINCHIKNAKVSGNDEVGGLVGCNLFSVISDCSVTGQVTGLNMIGGLAGSSPERSTIRRCSADVLVKGRDQRADWWVIITA